MDDLRGALALMPDAALLVEPQGAVVAANDAAAELFGTPDLEGRPLAQLLPFGPKPDRGWRPASARRANKTPLPVEACARELGDGRLLYGVRALRDSAVLEEALRYFDVAFDRSPIGMALFNTDGEYVRVNAPCRSCWAGRPRSCSAAATRSSPTPTTARPTSTPRGRSSRAGSTPTRPRSASCAPTARSCGRWRT